MQAGDFEMFTRLDLTEKELFQSYSYPILCLHAFWWCVLVLQSWYWLAAAIFHID
jgi:hypothetical protein